MNVIMKICIEMYMVIILPMNISPIITADYQIDVDGLASVRGDLHLYVREDFTTLNIGYAAGAMKQYDTDRFNTMVGILTGYEMNTQLIKESERLVIDEKGLPVSSAERFKAINYIDSFQF